VREQPIGKLDPIEEFPVVRKNPVTPPSAPRLVPVQLPEEMHDEKNGEGREAVGDKRKAIESAPESSGDSAKVTSESELDSDYVQPSGASAEDSNGGLGSVGESDSGSGPADSD